MITPAPAATSAQREDSRQRLRLWLKRTLTAQAVCAACIALQWLGLAPGWTTVGTAAGFTAFTSAGNLACLLATAAAGAGAWPGRR